MAQHEFSLKHGLPFGKGDEAEPQYDVLMSECRPGDLIDARMESQLLVSTPEGYRYVLSPEHVAINILRRQIRRIGKIQGPLSLHQLKSLEMEDYERLVNEAENLDTALFAERLSDRGRPDDASGQP